MVNGAHNGGEPPVADDGRLGPQRCGTGSERSRGHHRHGEHGGCDEGEVGPRLHRERVGRGQRVARETLQHAAAGAERHPDGDGGSEAGPTGGDHHQRVGVGALAEHEPQQVIGLHRRRPLGEVDGGQTGHRKEEQRDKEQGWAPATGGVGLSPLVDRGRGSDGHGATAPVMSLIHCFAEAGPP